MPGMVFRLTIASGLSIHRLSLRQPMRSLPPPDDVGGFVLLQGRNGLFDVCGFQVLETVSFICSPFWI